MLTVCPPAILTHQGLPGVRIERCVVSVEYAPKSDPTRFNRLRGATRYRHHIALPRYSFTGNDLESTAGRGLQHGLESILAFLAFDPLPEEFPPRVARWATRNQDDLRAAWHTFKETPGLVKEF